MCVSDVFNEVSTRLDRQAHLYDRFPHDRDRLSCLKATVPVDSLQVRFPHVSIIYCDATRPRVRNAVGAAHTFSIRNQQVRQYRGTQPHSTESTMTSVFGCQAKSDSVRQYQSVHNKIVDKIKAEVCLYKSAAGNFSQCTVKQIRCKNKKCRSLPVTNTHVGGTAA